MEANTAVVPLSGSNVVRLPSEEWFKPYFSLFDPNDYSGSAKSLEEAAVDLRESIACEVGYVNSMHSERRQCNAQADQLEALADQLRQLHSANTPQPLSL